MGCLATTFVWIQHFGLLRSLLVGSPPLREEWLVPVVRGQRRDQTSFVTTTEPMS